jgi:hypothetical protein
MLAIGHKNYTANGKLYKIDTKNLAAFLIAFLFRATERRL